jgi:hypothetical protein
MSNTKYITSKIDNNRYCKTNGQFSRHLSNNGLTYKDYFEMFITGVTPLCYCGKPKSFYQKTESYANSCGSSKCVGKTVSNSKSQWTKEQKLQDSVNKKQAAKLKTLEDKNIAVAKSRETFRKKYGVEWSSQLDSQKSKSKNTKLKKYGIATYNNSNVSKLKNKNKSIVEKNLINEKRRKTNLELYGVENCFLRPDVKEKSAKSNSSGKTFTMPSGKAVKIRGYEDVAISMLLQIYNEDELVIDNMMNLFNLPIFQYINVNQHTYKYYPDIYIPKENKIIEVKSRWWWDGNGDFKYNSRLTNNLRKRKSVLDKGYNYELWLYENKNTYKILKNDSDFQA